MKARRVRLVTVVADEAAVDVAVAADALVVHLVPVLGKALGLTEDLGARHTVWAWREQRWRPLQVNRTLEDAGVVDGEVLHLTTAAPAQPPPGHGVGRDPGAQQQADQQQADQQQVDQRQADEGRQR
ncbi:MAG TPA: EsaB/YukD family protein [Motilibacteraceae bacterium]|nr:EsaB/YukD family protein [Motilibacteraceae bacterium]